MNPETYGASQYMRRLETAIRKQKDVVQAARITGDGVLKRDAQSKITDLTARYKQVAEASGLKTRMERTLPLKTKVEPGIITPTEIVTGHSGTPKTAAPFSIIEHRDDSGKATGRTYYGANGYKKKDIHIDDHGNPKMHPFGKHGEHADTYGWSADGLSCSRRRRELTEDERKENADIL